MVINVMVAGYIILRSAVLTGKKYPRRTIYVTVFYIMLYTFRTNNSLSRYLPDLETVSAECTHVNGRKYCFERSQSVFCTAHGRLRVSIPLVSSRFTISNHRRYSAYTHSIQTFCSLKSETRIFAFLANMIFSFAQGQHFNNHAKRQILVFTDHNYTRVRVTQV